MLAYPGCPGKRPLNGCSSSSSCHGQPSQHLLHSCWCVVCMCVCVNIQQWDVIMEELLRRTGLMDAWQTELQELLANLTSTTSQPAAGTSCRRKLFFQLQNCIDVCHETDRVSYVLFIIWLHVQFWFCTSDYCLTCTVFCSYKMWTLQICGVWQCWGWQDAPKNVPFNLTYRCICSR